MSGTSLQNLIRMANQIAGNFNYEKNDEKAVAATADHIRRFWAPLMREQIFAYQRNDGAELEPRARLALERLMASHPG